MTHDPANPFHQLARTLGARKAGDAATPGKASPPAVPAKKKQSRREEDDDKALFLNAVQRIKPLPKRGGKNRFQDGGAAIGAALAANAQKKQASQPEQPPRSGAAAPQAMPPGEAPDAAGEAEFSSAMRSLFPPAREKRDADGPGAPAASAEANEAEVDLFAKAMQGVVPVNGKGRDVAAPAGKGKGLPAVDPAKALRDVLEGRMEFALHHTDEYMEGYVVGVDPLVLARLRSGQYSPEKHLDMHGMNARQAYDALTWFIRDAYQKGLRTVVVVTGRGKNSPDGVGVLRPLLQRWLSRDPFKRVVLAFCTAKPGDGGPGAVYVLLRKYKKNRGKIIWEHGPADEDFIG